MTVDWRPLAQTMAEVLVGKEVARTPGLAEAFAEVPRHAFVPVFYRHRLHDGVLSWEKVDDTDPQWLSAIYSADETLVTQLRPWRGSQESKAPTSSTTMPSVMADMIDELVLEPGMSVLEMGTGTGYNAAILCHLLGQDAVTTSDIERDLVELARQRLAEVGYHPTFQPRDHAYDRLLATHSVTDIPQEWIRWTKPGGIILTDLRSLEHNAMGAWAKLTVSDDGRTATGHLMASRAAFMPERRTPWYAESGYRPAPLDDKAIMERSTRATPISPGVLDHPALGTLVWRSIPGVFWWKSDDQYGLHAPGGLWANVKHDGTVFYGGPEDLWARVEDIHASWERAGRPALDLLSIEVSASGETSVELPS